MSPLPLSPGSDLSGKRADPDQTLSITGKLPVWLLPVLLATGLASVGCASTLVKSEKVIRDSIIASEQTRCTVLHVQPCLTDDQFKAVNAVLYRAAVAGSHVTALEAVHQAKPGDYGALYMELLNAVAAFKATGIGGPAGHALDALVQAQANLQAYLQKHGVQLNGK